jgi:hypothetical protein
VVCPARQAAIICITNDARAAVRAGFDRRVPPPRVASAPAYPLQHTSRAVTYRAGASFDGAAAATGLARRLTHAWRVGRGFIARIARLVRFLHEFLRMIDGLQRADSGAPAIDGPRLERTSPSRIRSERTRWNAFFIDLILQKTGACTRFVTSELNLCRMSQLLIPNRATSVQIAPKWGPTFCRAFHIANIRLRY